MVQHTPVQGNYSLSKVWTCHMNNIPFGPCSSLEGLRRAGRSSRGPRKRAKLKSRCALGAASAQRCARAKSERCSPSGAILISMKKALLRCVFLTCVLSNSSCFRFVWFPIGVAQLDRKNASALCRSATNEGSRVLADRVTFSSVVKIIGKDPFFHRSADDG